MRNLISNTQLLSGLLALLAVVGCKDTTGPSEPAVGTVTVFAPQNELAVGGTVQLVATVLNETGVSMSRQVTWATSNTSVATVTPAGLVMALAGGETQITASTGGRSGSVNIRVQAAPCTATSARGTIGPGEARDGQLDASGCLFMHGINAEGWQFSLSTRTTLLIELNSSQFNPLLVVTDRQLNVVAWSDGGVGSLAQVVRTFAPGEYIVWISSFDDRPQGTYRLSLQSTAPGACDTPVGSLTLGQSVSGALAAGDCTVESGHLVDIWELTLAAWTTVQIDLTSSQFDTFLIVTDLNGNWIAADDDGGEGFNSRLVYGLPAGSYLVWATSYRAGTTGAYQLSVQTLASGGAPPRAAGSVPAAASAKPAGAGHLAASGTSFEGLLARRETRIAR